MVKALLTVESAVEYDVDVAVLKDVAFESTVESAVEYDVEVAVLKEVAFESTVESATV